MARTATKKASNIFVWIILGLLMIALTGFGITSFSGSASLVGSVGDARITANDYAQALQREMRTQTAQTGRPATLGQMTAQGIDRAVLDGLVARAALAHETNAMGISIGDEELARQVQENSGFMDDNGNFDRAGYEFALRDAGLTPADFEQNMREDVARSILQVAIVGGVDAPDLFADVLTAYQTETRDFSLLRVSEADLPTGLAAPTQSDLEAEYAANEDLFTRPETRMITYAWVRPVMIMDDMEIDEEALRSLYAGRSAEYNQPERRLLERLVYPSREEADAARAALDAGDSDYDALVAARGLSLDDVDMGEVARDDLSDAAAEAVFSTEDTEIIGPVDSVFGPAIFRVNAVLDANHIPFEEAEEDLSAELAAEAARRTISDIRNDVDDLLAGGATLEELADDTMLDLGQIAWVPGADDGIAGYDAFREAAALLRDGDFPELLDLSDGGVFALRLDEITPPTLPPLEEIRDAVAESWLAAHRRDQLAAHAQDLVSRMVTGTALEDLGPPITQEVQIRRQDFIPDLPPPLVAQMFQLDAAGDTAVIPGADFAVIARLDAIHSGQRGTPATDALVALIKEQATQSIAQDVFESFGQALEADVGISLNPSVINAVHAQFP
ncbi:peptidylprolyl isomerase [Rhodophyticola sp. CCM32]|uniref:peptidylprolyl isomerase n=1 Tax=Rhodophyticola sp. CCM32 TaxID=2916397 RepID=UPI00107F0164|nr:peptidylprolyl isomerase [Rhodophyticola sp. CCM32]QBY00725.1 peptidylprolyl isomerase [Rhodophyticola sp. CCM32]